MEITYRVFFNNRPTSEASYIIKCVEPTVGLIVCRAIAGNCIRFIELLFYTYLKSHEFIKNLIV